MERHPRDSWESKDGASHFGLPRAQAEPTSGTPYPGNRLRSAAVGGDRLAARDGTSAAKGAERTVGDFALHVQCAWRIAGPNGIVAASRDRYVPAGDPDGDPWHGYSRAGTSETRNSGCPPLQPLQVRHFKATEMAA